MMNILIADFDRKFVEELQRNWSIAGTNLLVCSDEKTLMPLIKKTSIDLAFIEVPFLMLDNMDMISYGPTLRGVHAPGEKIEIRTVEMFWNLTCEILRNLK